VGIDGAGWDGAGGDGAWFRSGVQAELDEHLEQMRDRLELLGPDVSRLVDQAAVATRGGKRLRASFCWWGHAAYAGPSAPQPAARSGSEPVAEPAARALLRACASLELLHASALVHDDLMDASDTRRGHPSAHRAFEAQHRDVGWRGDSAQYGAASAILLGDLLLSWSDELLRRSGLPGGRVSVALDVLDLCRSEVIAGQYLDVSVQARAHADVDAAMTVLRYKSAKYSVERPLQVGAALGGADAAQRAALTAYGVPLGEAFQLRDDVLGVFGDPAATGKPAGDDLVEGKRTVLVALALDAAPPAAARLLDSSLGRPLDPEEVVRLRAVIEDSGARQQVEDVIASLTALAVEGLGRAEVDPVAHRALVGLAEAATQRTV